MSPEDIEKWGTGWRAEEVMQAGIPGTGTGSKNVKRLIHKLGGEFLGITSTEGGTTIRFSIPIEKFGRVAAAGGNTASGFPRTPQCVIGNLALQEPQPEIPIQPLPRPEIFPRPRPRKRPLPKPTPPPLPSRAVVNPVLGRNPAAAFVGAKVLPFVSSGSVPVLPFVTVP